MKKSICFKDEEMQVVLHKSMEIYDTIKNTIIKLDDKMLSVDNKKFLSLLLGISTTKNQVGNILKIIKMDYNIKVLPAIKSENECANIYINNFCLEKSLNSNSTVEELMLYLLDNEFIEGIFISKGILVTQLKKVMISIIDIKKNDIRNLQKRKTMIS